MSVVDYMPMPPVFPLFQVPVQAYLCLPDCVKFQVYFTSFQARCSLGYIIFPDIHTNLDSLLGYFLPPFLQIS
jgi:hypothetical protein